MPNWRFKRDAQYAARPLNYALEGLAWQPPPPVPEVLALPVSTGPTLSERYNSLTKQLRDSLQKATRTP